MRKHISLHVSSSQALYFAAATVLERLAHQALPFVTAADDVSVCASVSVPREKSVGFLRDDYYALIRPALFMKDKGPGRK